MAIDLGLRRHLYEQAATGRGRRGRMFRKQLRALALTSPPGPDGGASGVREPRRPRPENGPTNTAIIPGG